MATSIIQETPRTMQERPGNMHPWFLSDVMSGCAQSPLFRANSRLLNSFGLSWPHCASELRGVTDRDRWGIQVVHIISNQGMIRESISVKTVHMHLGFVSAHVLHHVGNPMAAGSATIHALGCDDRMTLVNYEG